MQKITDRWIIENTRGYWKPNNIMLRLMEEIGELSREINHQFGEKPKKSTDKNKEISHEIGDVLFTIACLSNSLNIKLDKAFQYTMKKYDKRDKERHR